MDTSGPLHFDTLIRDINFRSQIDYMERRILGVTNTATRETNKLDTQFARLGQLAAGYFSFTALAQLPAQILKVRGEFQQLEIAFSTMLASKSKADTLLTSLVETAASTPFGLKDIASGAKQLLAYGSSAKNVVGELRMLGDVAAGVSAPINELIYLYGTLRTQGRAYAVDIRQFAGRGIPIYQALADVLKVNVDQVNDFVEAGKVGFKEVEQAFRNMTSSGGMFAGLMDAQSKSLLGLKERLSDAWDVMLNEIGKKNQDVAADLLTTATDVVEHYQDVIDILKIAAATYGTYKAAILLVSAAQRAHLFMLQSIALEQTLAAASGEVLTTQQARQIVVSKLLQRAQMELNATMLANPYVIVATAIAALVTAYFVLREEVQQVKSAQELLADAGKDISVQYKQQGSEVKTLVGIIKNQNVAESERLRAYEKLKSIAPDIVRGLDFQAAKTADLTKEVNLYLASLEKKIRLETAQSSLKSALEQDTEAAKKLKEAQDDLVKQSGKNFRMVIGMGDRNGPLTALSESEAAKIQLEKAVEVKKQTEKVVNDINQTISTIYTGGSKDAVNAEIQRLELVQSAIKDKLSPAYKQVEDQLKDLAKQREALTAAENKGQAPVAKTVEYYDAQIKKLKEQQAQTATNRAEYNRYQSQIDAAEKARRRLTGELTASEKKAAKDADKIGPYGSVSYWETIAQKAQEVLEKTPKTDRGKISQQQAILLDAQRKAEEARKAISVKTFDEELEEKRTKYELYNKYLLEYGKQTADAQFNDLIKSGQSYVDYLNRQIADLESQRENVGLTDKEAGNLSSLLDQRNEATGKKAAIEVFTDQLQQAGRDAQSLSDYLDVLSKKQALLDPNDNSSLAIQQRLAVAEQIRAAESDRQTQLRDYLASTTNTEQQRLAITKRYADLRAELDKQYQDKRSEAYQNALKAINKGEQDEVRQISEQAAQMSDEFKKLDTVILLRGRDGLKARIAQLKEYLDSADEATRKTITYQQKQKELQDANDSLNTDTLGSIKTFAGLAGDLGNALSSVNGNLGNTGRLLAAVAQGANLVTVAFDETASKTDKIAAGVQGLIGIVTMLTSSANERKQAEEEYYRSMIAQQNAYNLALNEQIGLQSQLEENVFVKNYEGRLKDSIAQLSSANESYQKALKKLQDGQVKSGQRNAIDWGNVGSGAAMGAAIGSAIVPVIGTAVGAVVGAIAGIFGGKKKEDEFSRLLTEYPELIKKGADGVDELNVALAETLVNQNLVDENTKLILQDTINWANQVKETKEQIRSIVSELAGNLGNALRDNLVNAFKDGTDSAQAFGDSVSDVLENILSQIIFNQVFSKQFDQLQKEMEASFGPGGDGSWTDDFGRFFGQAEELTKLFNAGLEQANATAQNYGLNVFAKNTADKQTNPNSVQGAIKGVSEETASILAGQINAIRITQADTNGLVRQQLIHLSIIASNSAYMRHLESIDAKLDVLQSDPIRAKGM
ncbi:hypothetical protein GCM10028806_28570 [Spirosoma terrae]|uniref:Tape measure protein N-terminal domain-containing protein n=1 Tax=Spirosoma terrae TaxID=1968276 RepID=A0A6L9LCT5_9BACT|nr:tape measure protein [Spirosoma terrae]NDU97182.1 hypothetical protein [Spirosoma terrae]